MQFKKPDRFPLNEFIMGFWGDALGRWYSEGLPPGLNPQDHFHFDRIEHISLDFGPIPSFVSRIIKEDERYCETEISGGGFRWVTKSLKTGTSMPQFIEHGVKSPSDYKMIKARFNPRDLRRYPKSWGEDLIEYYRGRDNPLCFRFPGFFWKARELMGLLYLSKAFYTEPRMMHDFFEFWADFLIETSEEVFSNVKPDYVDFAEDFSYKNGPHISPKIFEEFIYPSYRKITTFLRKKGIEIIAVDSDGDPTLLLPLLIRAGINCLIPLEVAASMNANKIMKKYGKKLCLIGGIDKRALAEGGAKLEEEVRSRFETAKQGGYIPSTDHNVSTDVSFQNYTRYIELRRELMFNI
jgi:uroporphyrinogen decarboxylase